ncbi:peroxiredoxin-like family protein [Nostoc sp.]|uniref:peroxiredoxin-like family protein n=1 Tax=Nostoc sp. TaxID=1180 RepID=UPI002FFA21E1
METNDLGTPKISPCFENLKPLDQMTSLTSLTEAFYQQYLNKEKPEIISIKKQATKELVESGIGKICLQTGDKIPIFSLPNVAGDQVNIVDLLARGPLVISFYRGSWCGYCNLEMRVLQKALPYIRAVGADLIAISPEKLTEACDLIETFQIEFPILSDRDNMIAKQFGLVYTMPPQLQPIFRDKFDINVPEKNGNDSWELPITATYIVAPDRTIIHAFTDPNHTHRLEPRDIIEILCKQL